MTNEEKRRDEVLERMLNTPPTPHKKSQKGDSDRKKKAQPDS